jgi:hypothetical protein
MNLKKNIIKIGKTLYSYWMKFAHVLGTINGFIILLVVYFVVIGVYAIIFFLVKSIIRLFSKKKDNNSFWKHKELEEINITHVKFQF